LYESSENHTSFSICLNVISVDSFIFFNSDLPIARVLQGFVAISVASHKEPRTDFHHQAPQPYQTSLVISSWI
jgi:hypothetical protein